MIQLVRTSTLVEIYVSNHIYHATKYKFLGVEHMTLHELVRFHVKLNAFLYVNVCMDITL